MFFCHHIVNFILFKYIFFYNHQTNKGDIIIYLIILIAKILENALATLRSIILTTNKKGLGAFLNLVISLVWIFATTMVLIDIEKDMLKIVAFALGSYIGSYVGCIIEESLALGNNLIMCITSKEKETLIKKLEELNYEVIVVEGKDNLDDRNILFIMTPRKSRKRLINTIKRIDRKSSIIIENANSYANK